MKKNKAFWVSYTKVYLLVLILTVFSCKNQKNKDTIELEEKSQVENISSVFSNSKEIGSKSYNKPLIAHLAANDLNNDGLLDVLVCDMETNSIGWIKQNTDNTFTEIVIAEKINGPAHIEVIDFDEDGDKDLIVAALGQLFPSNEKIGAVIILENTGEQKFKVRKIVENVARVCDVRAGDLDGDGDKDLAVAHFGYDDGETRWIENLGNWEFKSHILQNLAGPLNIEVIDIDNDSDLDLISLVTQEYEEIYCFINDGKGNFGSKLLWGSNNKDYGSSGISIVDLDKDGLKDILYTNGDAFDYLPPMPRPWHGVQWLKNQGNLSFKFERICDLPGAFSARAVDIDNDNDNDILALSGFNYWDNPKSESFVLLKNDGSNKFIKQKIANLPTHLITLELGDFNNDKQIEAVTGGVYAYPPYKNMKRVVLWNK